MPLSIACQRYGLEQMDACKPAFGQRGAQLLLIFYLINMLGWSGLILVMFGNGLRNIGRRSATSRAAGSSGPASRSACGSPI